MLFFCRKLEVTNSYGKNFVETIIRLSKEKDEAKQSGAHEKKSDKKTDSNTKSKKSKSSHHKAKNIKKVEPKDSPIKKHKTKNKDKDKEELVKHKRIKK